jgi:hypothetical protein|tara:strand:+ start:249 stop:470 length:222 start_codon:yes stop_codon:yes gene_type:complete
LATDATDFLAIFETVAILEAAAVLKFFILETVAVLKLPQDTNSEQEIRVRLIGVILWEKVVKDLGILEALINV